MSFGHLCLNTAAGVIYGPPLPERPTIVPGGAKGFVSGDGGRAVRFLRTPIPTDRRYRNGLPVEDGGAVSQRVQQTSGAPVGDLHCQRFLPPTAVSYSPAQPSPDSFTSSGWPPSQSFVATAA